MIEITVKGMTCGHCVANVKKTLEAIDGVSRADVSLENNQALIEQKDPKLSKSVLVKAIVDAGYEAN